MKKKTINAKLNTFIIKFFTLLINQKQTICAVFTK